jgi:hypothetical protein
MVAPARKRWRFLDNRHGEEAYLADPLRVSRPRFEARSIIGRDKGVHEALTLAAIGCRSPS